jgi:pimeloyl-ACP methyl ester carboxylesterase
MRASRIALLKFAIGTVATLLIFATWLALPRAAFSSDSVIPPSDAAPAFTDIVSSEQLYAPHILRMAESHLIQGKGQIGAIPEFQPARPITRAELAKVTAMVRLAEKVDANGAMERIRLPQEIDLRLRSYYRCDQGICGSIGGKPFWDVAEKADSCAQVVRVEDLCDDWFTQYAYFAVAKGYAKGYPPAVAGGSWSFRPADPVLRIHALKMLMAEDGNTALGKDTRYKRLLAMAESEKAGQRCLEPQALTLILERAGGVRDEGAKKLLAYAKLADRLGLFGGTEFGGGCAVFGPAYSPQLRADFLFRPLTRQEAARYAAFTSDYIHIQVDRENHLTIRGQIPGYAEETPAPDGPPKDGPGDPSKDTAADPAKTPLGDSAKPAKPAVPATPPPCGRATAPRALDTYYRGAKSKRVMEAGSVLCLAGTSAPDAAIGEARMAVAVREGYAYGIPCSQLEGIPSSVSGCPEGRRKAAEIPKAVTPVKGVVAGPSPRPAVSAPASAYPNMLGGIESLLGQNPGNYKKATEEILKIQAMISKTNRNMEDALMINGDARKTCKSALGGKKNGSAEYGIMMAWCAARGITEADNPKEEFRLDKEYTVARTELAQTFPIQTITEGQTLKTIEISATFKIAKEGNFSSSKSDPDRNTYIIIHGWNEPYGNNECVPVEWPGAMANRILAIEPSAQILRLDWSKIACTPIPMDATKWFGLMNQEIVKALNQWGINRNKTTIIGFSLGGLFNEELSEDLGDANIISLDPAYSPWGYEVNFEGAEFHGFKNYNSACIVADASWSGSETAAHNCRENYLVDYSGNPGAVLLSEMGDYAKFSIDKAVGDLVEHLVDNGFTYAVNEVLGSDKKAIPIVKVYRALNGETKEVAIETVIDKACKPVNKAAKIPYFCQYAIGEITERFVTYHANVPKTYGAIISNPFYDDWLSPADLSSRKFGSAPFVKMDLSHPFDWDKQAHGIVYTEKDNPTAIKYLKVQIPRSPDKYTLYGNTQPNAFECRDDKSCIMYGGNGHDAFVADEYSRDYIIKDFKKHDNDDKIIIRGNGSNAALTHATTKEVELDGQRAILLTATCGDCIATEREKGIINRDIYLVGVAKEEAEGWVKTAINNTKLEKEQWGKSPIIIN